LPRTRMRSRSLPKKEWHPTEARNCTPRPTADFAAATRPAPESCARLADVARGRRIHRRRCRSLWFHMMITGLVVWGASHSGAAALTHPRTRGAPRASQPQRRGGWDPHGTRAIQTCLAIDR
jgi:hypothetical protein